MKVPENQLEPSDTVSAGRVKRGQPSLLQNATEGIKANAHFQSNFFHICLHDSIGKKKAGRKGGMEEGRKEMKHAQTWTFFLPSCRAEDVTHGLMKAEQMLYH